MGKGRRLPAEHVPKRSGGLRPENSISLTPSGLSTNFVSLVGIALKISQGIGKGNTASGSMINTDSALSGQRQAQMRWKLSTTIETL